MAYLKGPRRDRTLPKLYSLSLDLFANEDLLVRETKTRRGALAKTLLAMSLSTPAISIVVQPDRPRASVVLRPPESRRVVAHNLFCSLKSVYLLFDPAFQHGGAIYGCLCEPFRRATHGESKGSWSITLITFHFQSSNPGLDCPGPAALFFE